MAGIASACALVVLGVFAVASFRPADLPMPYWGPLDWMRTDTSGLLCFVMGIVAFGTSEYLRIQRRADELGSIHGSMSSPPVQPVISAAAARTFGIAGALVVMYLSVNAVTHPWSLGLPVSHLLTWPSESTLRVLALIVVAVATAVARAQRIQIFGSLRVR
jgi:hypothetical protein